MREILKGFLRIGIFVGGGGFVLLLLQPPGTAEYVVSACSTAMGLVLVVGALGADRLLR